MKLIGAALAAAAIAITLGTIAGDQATIIGGAIAGAAAIAAGIVGELQNRRSRTAVEIFQASPPCPSDSPPADGGLDRLVALVTGHTTDVAEVARLLAHLEICPSCAGKFRTIAILRGIAPATEGDVELTPDSIIAAAERESRSLM